MQAGRSASDLSRRTKRETEWGGTPRRVESKADGAEDLSVQEDYLSGHVQKMKSLFESSSSERTMNDDCEQAATSESCHVHPGLSCDGGLLSSVKIGNAESGTGRAVEATKAATEDAKAAEMGEKKVGNMMGIPGDYATAREDTEHKGGEKTRATSPLMAGKRASTMERASRSHQSSQMSSHVDSIDESSSGSIGSSDNLSQPVSHFVGSCMVM
ncbi:hypothetical protein FGB62_88g028 [Gracilaria domingensis]|nr:hypothetical protein FGB62_88g028 [Gracilaria domingensis]